jgi:hypothetical protein
VDWCLGLAMGVLIGLWVAVSDSPPAHIENWLRGAEGERKTERAQRVVECNRIVYVHGAELAGWLASRPHTLPADRCDEIRTVISRGPI